LIRRSGVATPAKKIAENLPIAWLRAGESGFKTHNACRCSAAGQTRTRFSLLVVMAARIRRRLGKLLFLLRPRTGRAIPQELDLYFRRRLRSTFGQHLCRRRRDVHQIDNRSTASIVRWAMTSGFARLTFNA